MRRSKINRKACKPGQIVLKRLPFRAVIPLIHRCQLTQQMNQTPLCVLGAHGVIGCPEVHR